MANAGGDACRDSGRARPPLAHVSPSHSHIVAHAPFPLPHHSPSQPSSLPIPRPDLSPPAQSAPPASFEADLPPLSSVARDASTASHLRSSHTSSSSISSPTTTAPLYHAPANMMEVDNNSLIDERSRRATSVLSMDDLEAAQALEGLRSEHISSPRASARSAPSAASATSPTAPPGQPEPLLSLLTSTHPLISSAINGSMSAYTTSKSYSPRFKYGAEFIERNIGSPVANTVGNVGRKTGVESGLRWALQRRESASTEDDGRSKRRKVDGDATADITDVEQGLERFRLPSRTRSSSDMSVTESLPPYDEQRSPQYEEVGRDSSGRPSDDRRRPSTWQSRLMISTSGLGAAMSEESLRSLQYCLTWLRWANGRLGKAIVALQAALREWEKCKEDDVEHQSAAGGNKADSSSNTLLTQRIQAVKEDVLSTLKQVVDVVSKYAGGALPENARHLVRRHLTSLPQRFQIASTSRPPPGSTAAESDATLGAHRILVLAQEGLDMMAQVSGVVNETLVSAEHWCARLGKPRPSAKSSNDLQAAPSPDNGNQSYPIDVKEAVVVPNGTGDVTGDVSMGGVEGKV